MHSKGAVIASAVLLIAGAWWWISREPERDLAEEERAARVGEARSDAQPTFPSLGSTARNPSESASLSKDTDPETERAPSDSPRRLEALLERQSSPGSPRAVNAGDGEKVGEHEEFARFKERLGELSALSQGTEGAIEAPLNPEDLDQLDLDGDQAVSSWEVKRAQRLVDRAENYPVKHDLGDGAYPVERADYRGMESEFDAVDMNQDGLLDVDEYYSFLFVTESAILRFDANQDGQISLVESGLSRGAFETHDLDANGSLMRWEIRRAVAHGALN